MYFPGSAVIEEEDVTKPSPKLKQLPTTEAPKDSIKSTGAVTSPAESTLYKPESLESLRSDVSSRLEFANANAYSGSSDSFPEIERDDGMQRSSTYRSYNTTVSSDGSNTTRKRSYSVTRLPSLYQDRPDTEQTPGGPFPRRMSQSRTVSCSSGAEPFKPDDHFFGDDTTLANSSTRDVIDASSKGTHFMLPMDMYGQGLFGAILSFRATDTLARSSAPSQSRHSLSHCPKDDLYHPWLREDDAESSRNSATSLYHPSMTQPLNPRDHSLLERIYKEMHAARFINLAPLSIIVNAMNMFFSRECSTVVSGSSH